MIIIGVDFHPEFQQIAFVDTDTGELQEQRLHHPDEAESVLPRSGEPGKPCEWEWRPAGTRAGSSGCWVSCRSSCGSEMQPRSEPSGYGSRRRIGKMPSSS